MTFLTSRLLSARQDARDAHSTDSRRSALHLAIAQRWESWLLFSDVLLLTLSTLVSYALRMEGFAWGPDHTRTALVYLACSVPLKIFILHRRGVYKCLWRHSSYGELERLLEAAAIAGAFSVVLGSILLHGLEITPVRVPLLVLAADWLFFVASVAGPRLLVRKGAPVNRRRRRDDARIVLIAGAGDAGKKVVADLLTSGDLRRRPIGFIDDAASKHGMTLSGLPVFGPLSTLDAVIAEHGVGEVIIAMPTASGKVVRRIAQTARDAGVPTCIVPGLPDILSGRVRMGALRPIEIQDLLRREPVQTDLGHASALSSGQTLMVTGAGGSIGSELCRQLCELNPARLVLLGHGENSIYEIRNELGARFPNVVFETVIADVRDAVRIRAALERYAPSAVYHAAAHKHVPLMEHNISEAVLNNVLGTKTVVELCAELGVERFVMVSTDKAVCPTNVMGASKRAAEQIVQSVAESGRHNYIAVRFGNVLGSRGSVVPLMLKQIRAGGPVTVTHPEMRRYFMTIPEAVQLVLYATAIGKGGEVFVLDMGEAVRIVDLATDLIRLSGFEVGTDIDIAFTGSRPGEKLYEELFFGAEHAEPTCHPKILKAKNAALEPGVSEAVEELIRAAHTGATDDVLLAWLRELVPTFERAPKGQAPAARPWRPTPRLVEVVTAGGRDPNDASATTAAAATRATPRIRHAGNE